MTTNLNRPARILHIDDNLHDRDLVQDALDHAEMDFEITSATTREEFELKLKDGKFDIILSDFNILGYTGLDVLKAVQQHHPELPVVLLTGTGTEEVAVEALKRGAADYVVKSRKHIQRLPLTIMATLDAARIRKEHRTAQAAEAESTELLRTILAGAPDSIITIDERGIIESINAATLTMFGYAETELEGQNIKILMPRPYSDEHDRYIANYLNTDKTKRLHKNSEVEGQRKDGTTFPLALSVSELFLSGRRYFTGILHDISERRANEELQNVLNRTLRVLSRCNEALVRATDETSLLKNICSNLTQIGGYPLAWVGFVQHEQGDEIRPVMHSGEASDHLGQLNITRDGGDRSQGPTGLAASTRKAVTVHNLESNPECAHLWMMAKDFGFTSAAAFPLITGKNLLGVLTLYSRGENAFDTDEMALLTELSEDLTYGIEALRTAVARREAEASLQLRTRAIEASSNGIIIADMSLPGAPIIYVNPAFERITGYAKEELLGQEAYFLLSNDRNQKGVVDIRSAMRLGREGYAVVRNYRRDGTLLWNELSVAPVRSKAGLVTHYVSVINDVTKRKQYEEELEHQANYDTLTGLANRNLFNDRLQQGIVFANHAHRLLVVLLLDLDRFKIINDSLGHNSGDLLLQSVAARLNGCIRPSDTVARLGNDEFALILAQIAEIDDLAPLIGKIETALKPTHLINGQEIRVSVSIGISLYPRDGEESETLIRNADTAMYLAKEEGGDAFRFFSPEMNKRVFNKLEMENALRQGLAQDELLLHYQPKVDLISGEIIGAEALVRWKPPGKQLVSPADFIPLAEETGLILPLGAWVLKNACAQLKSWHDQGLQLKNLAINLSARQFRQEGLVAMIEQVIAETGVDPTCLELELTESMVMHNPEAAVLLMIELKALNIRLALDDFGTGYSSLNYLRRFPVDTLKVDRSFVNELTTDPGCVAIASSVIDLAHNFKLKVVAEGVETHEQLALLRQHHCNEMQGYLFSRPLPVDEFTALLREGRRMEFS